MNKTSFCRLKRGHLFQTIESETGAVQVQAHITAPVFSVLRSDNAFSEFLFHTCCPVLHSV